MEVIYGKPHFPQLSRKNCPMNSPCYVVITPARNEGDYIGHTIASMAGQTVLPFLWIIVNDGSTDRTKEIVDAAVTEYPWIRAVHRPDRGYRQQGSGVIEAFYEGFERVPPKSWDFLVKFDADLSFPPDYFARCFAKFSDEPTLGIGGGLICQEIQGRLVCESPGDPIFHVRGATKIYRRACWEGIGGLLRAPGWDTIDELKANLLEWRTFSFTDIPLRHHRFTGKADGKWKNYVKFGLANYITGYHPLFMAAKCLKRMLQRPYVVGGIGLAYGFLKGYWTGASQVDDRRLVDYVHRQQLNRLLNRPSLWDHTTGEVVRA